MVVKFNFKIAVETSAATRELDINQSINYCSCNPDLCTCDSTQHHYFKLVDHALLMKTFSC